MPGAIPTLSKASSKQCGCRGRGAETPSPGNSFWQQLGEGALCVQLGGRESKDKRKPGRNSEGKRWVSGGSDKEKRRKTDKERADQDTEGKQP